MTLKEKIRNQAANSGIGYNAALNNIEARYQLGDLYDPNGNALEIIQQLRDEGAPVMFVYGGNCIVEHGRIKSLEGWAS